MIQWQQCLICKLIILLTQLFLWTRWFAKPVWIINLQTESANQNLLIYSQFHSYWFVNDLFFWVKSFPWTIQFTKPAWMILFTNQTESVLNFNSLTQWSSHSTVWFLYESFIWVRIFQKMCLNDLQILSEWFIHKLDSIGSQFLLTDSMIHSQWAAGILSVNLSHKALVWLQKVWNVIL